MGVFWALLFQASLLQLKQSEKQKQPGTFFNCAPLNNLIWNADRSYLVVTKLTLSGPETNSE